MFNFLGDEYDETVDIFSFGIVLCEVSSYIIPCWFSFGCFFYRLLVVLNLILMNYHALM